MAVLTAERISSLAVALLTRTLVLPRTVSMIPGSEFSGGNGDTITVRVRQPREARTQSAPNELLIADEADEVPVQVSMAHLYNLHNLTDQEATFELADFGLQVTLPQVRAVAIGAENAVATAMNNLDPDIVLDADGTDIEDSLIEASERLDEADVPADERYCAVSPRVASLVMGIDTFVRVDASGSDQLLRQAVIGKLYNFTFVKTNGLTRGHAVAYHSSGFAFATRPPVNPRGATDSAVVNEQGIALRQVFQYDATRAKDQSLVSTFAGASAVYDDDSGLDNRRFVKLEVESS